MFGKPEWFRPKTWGWGLYPITWQGWVYALFWAALIVGPFNVFIFRGQYWEAGVWMAATIGFLVWETAMILRAIRRKENGEEEEDETPKDDVLYIGDDQEKSDHLATRNFDMQLRD